MKSKFTCIESEDGHKYWYNSYDEIHREDGPAIEYSNGNKVWMINGVRHREDGPAIMFLGYSHLDEWWYNGCIYNYPSKMPLNLFINYCRYEYNKQLHSKAI